MIAKGVAELLAPEPPDLVIATGDLAQAGLDSEFRAVEELLAPLSKRGVPVIFTPGNHDLYGGGPTKALLSLRARLALDLRINAGGIVTLPGLEILALNQAVWTPPFLSYGRVDPNALLLAETSWNRPSASTVRLVCGHYPLPGADISMSTHTHGLKGWQMLLGFLQSAGVSAYLCGHTHKAKSMELGAGVRQFVAPAFSNGGKALRFSARDGILEIIGSS